MHAAIHGQSRADGYVACAAASNTYVKVRCEGDRTRPFYAKQEEGSSDSAVFENAQYGFIILHSNAVMLVKARDQAKGQFYGQVRSEPIPFQDICACKLTTHGV